MIEIVNTLDGLTALKPVWERIEIDSSMRVFQSFAWTYSAWTTVLSKNQANRLWVVKWTSGEDVVILPTYIDAKGVLRLILDRGVDVGNAVYCGGRNHHLAYIEIAKAIQEEPLIKSVHLQKLAGDSELLDYLGVLLRPSRVYKDNAYSWLNVEPSDDFVAAQKHMRSKDRADLKNLKRKAEAAYKLSIVSFAKGDVFPEREMRYLIEQMSKGTRRSADFLTEDDIAFVKALFNAGKCEIAILSDSQGLQALNVILVQGNRRLSWEFLYLDPRSGTSLYLLYLSQCKMPESYVFDFGVGVYSYKIGTFRPCLSSTFSFRYEKTVLGWIKLAVYENVHGMNAYIKASR